MSRNVWWKEWPEPCVIIGCDNIGTIGNEGNWKHCPNCYKLYVEKKGHNND